MNYEKHYNNLIKKALEREIPQGYTETHHIIPKCLGGTNDADNLVILTAREHYICHWLLAKQHKKKELYYAFSMMIVKSNKQDRYSNGILYERAKLHRSLATIGENNPMFGKKSACVSHTEETKEKIRMSKLGKKRNPFSRKPASEETKKKISQTKLNKKKTI